MSAMTAITFELIDGEMHVNAVVLRKGENLDYLTKAAKAIFLYLDDQVMAGHTKTILNDYPEGFDA